MKNALFFLTLILLGCQSSPPPSKTTAPAQVILASDATRDRSLSEARGPRYAIATQGVAATQAAARMIEQGGNIIDATVAASFAISVERPQSSGLGGGGFFMYHEAHTGRDYAIDFRERAPQKAFADMYIGPSGKADPKMSLDGIKAAAVPGLVAGLAEIHAKWGRLSWSQVLAPAIEVAEKGFVVYPDLAEALASRAKVLARDPEAKKIFLDTQGRAHPAGFLLKQPDLARSMRLIAKQGRKAFYEGEIGKSLVSLSKKQKGYIREDDLKNYEVKWRTPLKGRYRENEVVSMPPPSSGGAHVLQFLGFLEQDRLRESGPLSLRSLHLGASALQSAFADRARYLGDPDFVKVPIEGLIDPEYLRSRRAQVPMDRARHVADVAAGNPPRREGPETTHLSMMDAEGNAVATTQTVNGYMGAALVIPGTGILLNNEMDDFSAQTGAQNLFGAVGGEANKIEPRKTPLSSMSPTFLLRDGKVILAVGAPGGTRIISCVAQTILNYVEFGLPLYESIAMVRFHHQWQPDVLRMDAPGPSPVVLEGLRKMGYEVKLEGVDCNVMAVAREGQELHAVADPRDIGTSFAK